MGLFLDPKRPLFYQQCNARDVENSKLTGHHVTIALWVQSSKLVAIVADVNDPATLSHSEIFLFLIRRLCWLWFVLMLESKFSVSSQPSVLIMMWNLNCLYPLHRLCWLWCVLMRESKFSGIMYCLQWNIGRCRSLQVFVFFSVLSSFYRLRRRQSRHFLYGIYAMKRRRMNPRLWPR